MPQPQSVEPAEESLVPETPKQEQSTELLDVPSEVIEDLPGITETEIPSEVMRSPETVEEEEKKIETETSDSE